MLHHSKKGGISFPPFLSGGDQLTDMRGDGAGESLEIVTTFEDGDEAGIAMSLRGFEEVAGEQDEVVIGEAELAERVVDA